jgi:hypothetical protein
MAIIRTYCKIKTYIRLCGHNKQFDVAVGAEHWARTVECQHQEQIAQCVKLPANLQTQSPLDTHRQTLIY